MLLRSNDDIFGPDRFTSSMSGDGSPLQHGSTSVDGVEVWEVITEMSGPRGVYASYIPYQELYVVVDRGSIVAEFSGWQANARLEKYLQANGIPYPKGPDAAVEEFVPSKLILV